MYETTIFFLDRLQILILQVKCTLNKYKVFKKLCATITLVFSLFVSSRRKRRRRASRHKKALKCQQDKSKVRPFMVCPNTLLIWANFSSQCCWVHLLLQSEKDVMLSRVVKNAEREREASHFYELKYV